MAAHCGRSDGWHDERGYEDGHIFDMSNIWCSGRQPEQLYNMKQAVILGRRALCESSDQGHNIQRTGSIVIRNWNGTVAQHGYGCVHCDLIVKIEYPSLLPAGPTT